jgi:hypothetical protein
MSTTHMVARVLCATLQNSLVSRHHLPLHISAMQNTAALQREPSLSAVENDQTVSIV